jgi:hypothetical protein
MDNVISLDDFRKKKLPKPKQIKEAPLSTEERYERIRQSLARVNELMAKIKAENS